MSNPLKSIGKVFKKVTKFVKKIAVPALAVGAVILTGGAALGALPALSTTIGSLGLSPALTGVLTTAAKGATMGFGTSLLTGGNPIKGATKGFIAGGLLGGATQAINGLNPGGVINNATGVSDAAVKTVDLAPSSVAPDFGTAAAAADLTPVANGVTNAATRTVSGGGGLLGFAERNPILTGSVLQGVGGGLMAATQAKEVRKAEQRIRDSYSVNPTGLWTDDDVAAAGGMPMPRPQGRLYWDSKEMRLRSTAEG